MSKNIEWKKSNIDYDKLNELSHQQLTRIENGKKTIGKNSSTEGRSKGGQTNKLNGHIQSIGKKWGAIQGKKNTILYSTKLLGAKAAAEKLSTKVLQLDMEGNLIKEWDSMNEAGKNGFTTSAICKCCNNIPKHKSHKGFIWKFK